MENQPNLSDSSAMYVLPADVLQMVFDNLMEQKLKDSLNLYVTLQKSAIPLDRYNSPNPNQA